MSVKPSRRLMTLLPKPTSPQPTDVWGTVLSTSPLTVRLDGASNPLAGPPDSLVTVAVGNRVMVRIANRRAIIIGVSK